MRRATRSAFKIVTPPGSRSFTVFYTLHKLFCKVCAMMCPLAHNVCFRRTFMELVLTNYEILLYFGGELIAISNALKYTEGIDFLAACPSLAFFPNVGCGRHPQKGAAQNLKGWYKALEDLVWLTQLGLNMLLPLVLCLAGCWWAVEHWGWPEWLFLPAVGLGLAAGAQNFWVFCKERLERSKHEKNHRVGFNSHQ